MLNFSKTVIYLDRQTIRVGQVSGAKLKNEQLVAEDWQTDDLPDLLRKIRQNFGKSAHVILGDDLSYVLYEKIKLASDESLSTVVSQVVAERIPEDSEKLHWHHQVLAKNEEEITVQIIAFVTAEYEQINSAFKEAGLKVERLEPLSLALAAQIEKEDEPRLLLYNDYRQLALVVKQSAVIASESLNTKQPTKELKALLAFVKDKYDLEIKNVEEESLEPLVGIIQLPERKEPVQVKAKKGKTKKALTQYWLFFAFVPILLILLLALLSWRGWLPEKFNVLQPEPEPVALQTLDPSSPPSFQPSPSPSLVPSPTPVNLGQYSVQILNGSGVAGAASGVEEILVAEGFVNFETDNAVNYDYVKTEVQLKENVPASVYADIERALNSDYELALQEESLNNEVKYDVIVTVGIKNQE